MKREEEDRGAGKCDHQTRRATAKQPPPPSPPDYHLSILLCAPIAHPKPRV